MFSPGHKYTRCCLLFWKQVVPSYIRSFSLSLSRIVSLFLSLFIYFIMPCWSSAAGLTQLAHPLSSHTFTHSQHPSIHSLSFTSFTLSLFFVPPSLLLCCILSPPLPPSFQCVYVIYQLFTSPTNTTTTNKLERESFSIRSLVVPFPIVPVLGITIKSPSSHIRPSSMKNTEM